MKIIALDKIKEALPSIDLISSIEEGFKMYSEGKSIVPPVGELLMDKGEVHIKYGCLKGDDYYVIKIASGFYDNPKLGLPSSNGLMMLFSQSTGELLCILLDEGYLTDIRTAVAGSIAAKYLAPKKVERIGIVGTGIQARLQLMYLKNIIECRDVLVWGRGEENLNRYCNDMIAHDFNIETTMDLKNILSTCSLIVTTTPSEEPLLFAKHLQKGTHITAVGSDTPHKQELDSGILAEADSIIADSIPQCLLRGEIYKAIKNNKIDESNLMELGKLISGEETGRSSDEEITVADLTGVAVQDIKIASAVFESFN